MSFFIRLQAALDPLAGRVFVTHDLDQWFSTADSWRPTKQDKTQFGDPYITIIVLQHRF